MPIPDYESLMLPLLKLLGDGQPHPLASLRQQLADEFQLTEDELAEMLPSGGASLFYSRVHWAKTYLAKALLLETESRGVVRITPRGRSLLDEKLPLLSTKLLSERFAEMREWRGTPKSQKLAGSPTVAEVHLESTSLSPEEDLEASYQRIRASVEDEIIRTIKQMPPSFFERRVVQLLLRLGYGGSPDSGEALGRSGDGGIDGVIKEDKLGLDLVYIQAKRWEGSVGGPIVRTFAGSLAAHRARKGVLITTSSFTRDAYADAERMNERIVLVDGKTLAALMYEVGLGVTTKAVYEVRRLDSDYFTDEP